MYDLDKGKIYIFYLTWEPAWKPGDPADEEIEFQVPPGGSAQAILDHELQGYRPGYKIVGSRVI